MSKNLILAFFQVDSFTQEEFGGNPAGVCILKSQPSEKWMQSIAAEMNLSETSFLWQENDHYQLKWFTPKVEVSLCGHATLASAHSLWSFAFCSKEEILFQTKSGLLKAKRKGKNILLDFPLRPTSKLKDQEDIEMKIGLPCIFVGKSAENDILVQVESVEQIKNYQPNFSKLAQLECRGIILTAQDNGNPYDFQSRFFAPRTGVYEDPVTGSAHCALAPYWAGILNKNNLLAFQASERGGEIGLKLIRDRVILKGSAKTIFKIDLLVG